MSGDELFEIAVNEWRNNKGIGTSLIPPPLDDKIMIYKILTKVYYKTPTLTTIIIVETINQRLEIIEFLTHQQDEENNNEFKFLLNEKYIRILTKSYIMSHFFYACTFNILYHPEDYDESFDIWYNRSKYRLTILNKLFNNNNATAILYKNNPLLETFKQNEIDELRISSPVEEMWVDVTIPTESEAWQLYQYYSKYIETSLNIFGSFDMIKQARVGNDKLNISSTLICNQIAQENGWSDNLDMNYDFNIQIDELYNPNSLRGRANKTYEIIRERNNLVSDYEKKLEKVMEIVTKENGHKILIINKRGEFANKVTNYLNTNSEKDICGNYHNKVDNIPAVDIDGNPVYIKSGLEKGKRKVMSYKAQMTLNEKKFNLNMINCLSLSNSPDKSLNVDFDVVIITSPLCEDIKSYLYRLTNICLNGDKIKLFSIFCKNTIEQQKLLNKPLDKTKVIVNKDKIMAEFENNSAFYFVD